MAKRHGRPSLQYRYEHYDPHYAGLGASGIAAFTQEAAVVH
jgi:hypothetical protein